MRRLLYFGAAILGLLTSICFHVMSLLGMDVVQLFPLTMMMHLYTLLTFIACLLQDYSKRIAQAKGTGATVPLKSTSVKDFKALFTKAPVWFRIVVIAGFLYASVNATIRLPQIEGFPTEQDGTFFIQDHGTRRELSEAEFHSMNKNIYLTFSSLWLVFLGMASLISFPAKKKEEGSGGL